MSYTSKSPRRVTLAAMKVGQRSLPRYAHRFAPKTFTQAQLFTCLVLKQFFATDYRGIVEYLHDMPELCKAMQLTRIPHYTTLQKASRRLLCFSSVRELLLASVQMNSQSRNRIEYAVADSSGFESGRISPYFVRRCARGHRKLKNPLYQTARYTKFPKLAIICDCSTHMILAAWPTRGPTPDVHQLGKLLSQLHADLTLRRLLLDAGYDSHANHQRLRNERNILSYIPPHHGRPTTKPASSALRRLMQRHFATAASRQRIHFGQRWQVETAFSMIKRNLDHAIAGRSYHAQNRGMLLLAITYNITIFVFTKIVEGFSTEQSRHLCLSRPNIEPGTTLGGRSVGFEPTTSGL
ncbi:MAG: transposase [Planctomycetes bacterium]|nr:transposase [Planctomycetota bacterium]MCH8259847.1 transposase [Planctomycetota bacterium]